MTPRNQRVVAVLVVLRAWRRSMAVKWVRNSTGTTHAVTHIVEGEEVWTLCGIALYLEYNAVIVRSDAKAAAKKCKSCLRAVERGRPYS